MFVLGFLNRIGTTELIIIAVILLVIFGPSKLPELGRSVGDTMRNFKEGAGIKSDKEQTKTSETDESKE